MSASATESSRSDSPTNGHIDLLLSTVEGCEPEFDVALSFAGEDRGYVHQVALALRERGIAVFYDEFNTVRLWGRDLYTYLDDIYQRQCRYVLAFASANYARGMWTSHERQSILSRLVTQPDSFLLLVRLDDSAVAGFRPTLGYLDGRRLNPRSLAEHVEAKLGGVAGGQPAATTVRVPLTDDELRRCVAIRPAGWEHLVLAGEVFRQWRRLESKRLDVQLGFGALARHHVNGASLTDYVQVRLDEFSTVVSALESLIGGEQLAWAIGAPGESGDPGRIQHLGSRFGSACEALLDWAATVRATASAPAHRRTLDLLAELARLPVHHIDGFVADLVDAAGRIADAASAQLPVPHVTLALELAPDPEALDALLAELRRSAVT